MSNNDWRPHPGYLETRFRVGEPLECWPAEFVIVSAYATTGEQWSDDDNELADIYLRDELDSLRVWRRRVVGFSPRSGHEEPSWAVELPLERALALGRRFRQDAIFHVVGDALYVVPCGEDPAGVSMGSFRERLELDADPDAYLRYDGVASLRIMRASGAAFRAYVDDFLIDAPAGEETRPARLLVPKEYVSIRKGLLAVLAEASVVPESAGDLEDLDIEMEHLGLEALLARFAKHRRVFRCAVTSSFVSGEWGLGELVIGDRGYLYNVPDFGIGADESLPILAAWEPADDPRARLACIRAVHAREWSRRGWPPYVADEVEAPASLLFDLLLQSLEREPGDECWEQLYERTARWLAEVGATPDLRGSVAASARADVGEVSRFSSLMTLGDPELPARLQSGCATPEERRVFAALVTKAIAAGFDAE